ncbi:MAG: chemotaxis protein CheW [Planctomycetota bacterium]|nr:MAG: chemotaxis protein CheW [Planctomycetota bacterium]RLS94561.1 MAG: chemotaxis protein CheW [Planctomycetota bacterium]
MQALFIEMEGRRYAIDASEILEVLPMVEYRAAQAGPDWLLGLFNRRGSLVPLIDLSRIVVGSGAALCMGSRIVVVQLLEGDVLGLLVAEVTGLGNRDFEGAGAHAGFAFGGAAHLGPTIPEEGGTLQLIRCDRLLADQRRLPLEIALNGDVSA